MHQLHSISLTPTLCRQIPGGFHLVPDVCHHLPVLLFHSCAKAFTHNLLSLEEYLMNLDEIFRSNRYSHLLHLHVHCHYGYQSMWFLWQHLCTTLSNLLTCSDVTWNYSTYIHEISRGNRDCVPLHLDVHCYYGLLNCFVSMATYLQYSAKFISYFTVT